MEQSMATKLDQAADMALLICYKNEDRRGVRDTAALFGENVSTLLWAYTDGLFHSFHYSRVEGRCSLDAFLKYDIGLQERKIEGHIDLFADLLCLLGVNYNQHEFHERWSAAA